MACTTKMQGLTVLGTYTRNPLLTPDWPYTNVSVTSRKVAMWGDRVTA